MKNVKRFLSILVMLQFVYLSYSNASDNGKADFKPSNSIESKSEISETKSPIDDVSIDESFTADSEKAAITNIENAGIDSPPNISKLNPNEKTISLELVSVDEQNQSSEFVSLANSKSSESTLSLVDSKPVNCVETESASITETAQCETEIKNASEARQTERDVCALEKLGTTGPKCKEYIAKTEAKTKEMVNCLQKGDTTLEDGAKKVNIIIDTAGKFVDLINKLKNLFSFIPDGGCVPGVPIVEIPDDNAFSF